MMIIIIIKRRQEICLLFSIECVPVKVVGHSGHTLSLTVVFRNKPGSMALDVLNFSYLLTGVWVPYGATMF